MQELHRPTNQAEFIELIESVDRQLREGGVPPHARPIRGWFEISSTLGLGLRMFPDKAGEPEGYSGDDLTIRIFRWFDEQYGNKLQIHPGPGRLFVVIRSDPWVVHIPQIYGSVKIFVSTTKSSSSPQDYLRQRVIPRYNALDSIDYLPDGLRSSFQSAELSQFLNTFMLGSQALVRIRSVESFPLVPEVQSDIDAAVMHAMNRPPHFGQSKWSSLQATEKILKAFLSSRTIPFPYHHRLPDLALLAEEAGLPRFEQGLLERIQCAASIRYGDGSTTLSQAFDAHVASLRVCSHVAQVITRGA